MEYNYNKCPECGYVNNNRPDTCPSCGFDLATYRAELSLKQAAEWRREQEEAELAEKERQYKEALDLLYSNQHKKAMVAFLALGSYKDSEAYAEKAQSALYDAAVEAFVGNPFLSALYTENADRKIGDIDQALIQAVDTCDVKILRKIRGTFKEFNGAYQSKKYIAACDEAIGEHDRIGQLLEDERAYENGVFSLNRKDYGEAIKIFTCLGDFKDSAELLKQAQILKNEEAYENGVSALNKTNYKEAIKIFNNLGAFKDSAELLKQAKNGLAEKEKKIKEWQAICEKKRLEEGARLYDQFVREGMIKFIIIIAIIGALILGIILLFRGCDAEQEPSVPIEVLENIDIDITNKANKNESYSSLEFEITLVFKNNNDTAVNYIEGIFEIKDRDGNKLANCAVYFGTTLNTTELGYKFPANSEKVYTFTLEDDKTDNAIEIWNSEYSELDFSFEITKIRIENDSVMDVESYS